MPIIKDSAPVFFPESSLNISKYLDLTKFLSLLSNSGMFFCRLDKLEDKFEGWTPSLNAQSRINWFKATNFLRDEELTEEEIIVKVNELYEYQKKVKEVSCVSCWNRSETESAALWKIYSDNGKGIMIKSTVSDLVESFKNTSEVIRISEVRYLDYENDLMPDGNTFYPIVHKQNAYEYEKEVRLIYEVDTPQIGKSYAWDDEIIPEGKILEVDINLLIREVVIGPFSPKWMVGLIDDLLTKYGLETKVRRSKLSI